MWHETRAKGSLRLATQEDQTTTPYCEEQQQCCHLETGIEGPFRKGTWKHLERGRIESRNDPLAKARSMKHASSETGNAARVPARPMLVRSADDFSFYHLSFSAGQPSKVARFLFLTLIRLRFSLNRL